MRKAFLGLLLLILGSLPGFAADLSGNWTFRTTAAGYDVTLQLALKQNDDSLTGTVAGPQREYPIEKGSVDRANKIEILVGGDGFLAGARIFGRVDGERLRLTIQTEQGQSDEGVAERSK